MREPFLRKTDISAKKGDIARALKVDRSYISNIENMTTEKQTPLDRLNYSGEIGAVINRLAGVYKIGSPTNFSVIGVGYEDCNVVIETPSGKYVAKIFSKDRNSEAIIRYSIIMEKAVEVGINHPPLIKTADGRVVYSDGEANDISMVLMKFVDGQTFLELDRAPDEEEEKAVVEQAVKVNGIDYHPPYLLDSWAIPNIKAMFERTKQFIQSQDIQLIKQAMTQYAEIPVNNLPHCFVHGDFTKANIMKGNDGKIYVLDFSVANWYPRIQELAVIAANLLHEENSSQTLRNRTERVSEMYDKLTPLTPDEKKHLYAYALAGVAMEFMGGHQEKFIKGNATEETEYWLNLGRSGLRKELSEK
ncbi:MAG: phosphotransferase [Candidatus Kerfeldbacteria bacterium]|nr:phosphotransferase [Candidatus Kerfeldbacteria bacterium]